MKLPLALMALYPLAVALAHSETLVLSSGRTIEGMVIRTNGTDLMLLTDYGVLNFARENIKEIKGVQAEATEIHSTTRLPDFKTVVLSLSRQKWGGDMEQIPATVIEKGMLRHVPYVSFRCSDDYEVNIYGDLKEPAAIEAGVYRKLLTDETAKGNCLAFISGILGEPADRDILQSLSRDKDLKVRNGVSFEVTPSTDEDAYQGWWISVFSQQKLTSSRATEIELKEISLSKTDAAKSTGDAAPGWSPDQLKQARPSHPQTISFVSFSGGVVTNAEVVRVVENSYLIWRSGTNQGTVRLEDLSADLQSKFGYDASKAHAGYATAQQGQSVSTTDSSAVGYSSYNSPSSGGGRVYVHGYTKKNGTYVQPYYRSAPGR